MRQLTQGSIVYRGDHGIRGREWFHRTDGPQGVVVRTCCEITDRDHVRDNLCALDPQFRPLDGYQRRTQYGRTSMAWFHFRDDGATCEGEYADAGRISQAVRYTERPGYFVMHPLTGDGLVPAAYDLDRGGRQVLHGWATSEAVDGTTGPLLMAVSHPVELLGREDLAVPAGTFSALHFRIWYGPGQQRFQDVWTTERYQTVQVRNDELATTYLLEALREVAVT